MSSLFTSQYAKALSFFSSSSRIQNLTQRQQRQSFSSHLFRWGLLTLVLHPDHDDGQFENGPGLVEQVAHRVCISYKYVLIYDNLYIILYVIASAFLADCMAQIIGTKAVYGWSGCLKASPTHPRFMIFTSDLR